MDVNGNNHDGSYTVYAELVADKFIEKAKLDYTPAGFVSLTRETLRQLLMETISEVERDLY